MVMTNHMEGTNPTLSDPMCNYYKKIKKSLNGCSSATL